MARGSMIDSFFYRRAHRFGLTIISLTPTFFKVGKLNAKGFLLYDEFKISKSGQLIGYWGMSSGKPYKDFTGIYPTGNNPQILRISKNYIIIK